ncbi:hypothetical protein [Nocardia sp. NBC_01329]|uniref:hypothetical protein n=1 Tax=Nocardia sp. NBC_01329 TaxID=2903594 RepID=UPI002E0FD098|nr:hypothetical protein OG405_10105 [Nocardia sp. NBC_01329]
MLALNWHRPLMLLAVAMAILTLAAIGGMTIDDRTLTGLPIWTKAVKFALSVVIYSVTWAWLIAQFTRWHRIAWWAGTVAAAGLGLELTVIVIQIVRGTTSHFNFTTPLNSALWETMGLSIIVVWLATLVASLVLLRNPTSDPARNAAIRYGAGLSLVGAALGLLMVLPTQSQRDTGSAVRGAHTVGLPDGGPGLPILGWSTSGGDLRIPHFIGMHAAQLLPFVVIALELSARRIAATRPVAVRTALVKTAAAVYTAVLIVLTWQALRGQSLMHPDRLTLSAAGLVAAAATGAVIIIVRRRPPVDPATIQPTRTAPGAIR